MYSGAKANFDSHSTTMRVLISLCPTVEMVPYKILLTFLIMGLCYVEASQKEYTGLINQKKSDVRCHGNIQKHKSTHNRVGSSPCVIVTVTV